MSGIVRRLRARSQHGTCISRHDGDYLSIKGQHGDQREVVGGRRQSAAMACSW